MNSLPSELERLINGREARSYLVQQENIGRLSAEIWGSEERLAEWFGRDMKHFKKFRTHLEEHLPEEQKARLERVSVWIEFLKLRVDLLDFGVGHYTNLGSYIAASFALLGVVLTMNVISNRWVVVVLACAAITAMLFAAVRAMIERRKVWYRYLITHLESVKEAAKNPG